MVDVKGCVSVAVAVYVNVPCKVMVKSTREVIVDVTRILSVNHKDDALGYYLRETVCTVVVITFEVTICVAVNVLVRVVVGVASVT